MILLISIFLLIMPWSRDPFSNVTFVVPIAAAYASVTLIPLFFCNIRHYYRAIIENRRPALILLYCAIAYGLGIHNLSESGQENLYLAGNEIYSYYLVGAKKLLQIFFIIIVYYEIGNLNIRYIDRFRSAWKIGFIISLAVHILVYLKNPVNLLPRAGTMDEGNFVGLYYLLTLSVILSDIRLKLYKKIFYVGLVALGIILSESTIGILALIFNLGLYFYIQSTQIARIIATIFIVAATTIVFSFNINNLYDKVFADSKDSHNFSKYDRMQSFEVGEKIFFDYPIMGLGLETYGFKSNDLLDQFELKFYNNDFRRIPNNIYIEILSQLGIVGAALFSLFFITEIRKMWGISKILFMGIISILLYWIAFPTFSVVYIWAYLGFCALFQHQYKQLAGPSAHYPLAKSLQ